MLKLSAILRRVAHLLPKISEDMTCWGEEWNKDPLSHPALQRMTLEELADLPFEREPARPDPAAAAATQILCTQRSR